MELHDLEKEILTQINGLQGEAAVIIEDLRSGERIEINPGRTFPAASLIKLPILLRLFRMVEENGLRLDERVVLSEEERVGGFGILKDLGNGLAPSIRDLAVLMIVMSDNIATNLLIRRLGMDEINQEIRSIGMTGTALRREMMDAAAKARGLDNETTAEDTAKVLKAILNHRRRGEMLDILLRQQCNNKLPARMGEDVKFAHKTGDLPGTEHDAGILISGGQEALVVVLTAQLGDNQDGIRLNQEIGAALYHYFIK